MAARLPSGMVAVLSAVRHLVDWEPGGDSVSRGRVRVGFHAGGMDAELPGVLLAQPWCRKVRFDDRSVTVWVRRSSRWRLISEFVEADLTGGLLETLGQSPLPFAAGSA